MSATSVLLRRFLSDLHFRLDSLLIPWQGRMCLRGAWRLSLNLRRG